MITTCETIEQQMKLHYKIISCSSQQAGAPVSNIVSGGGSWESARFCSYPQQLTLQFFQPVCIASLTIVAHPAKIPQRINIMFCMPDAAQNKGSLQFQKYGYVQFSNGSQGDYKLRQAKKVQDINMNALYMRLIIWKNHQNPLNFFNQVGLSQVVISGAPLVTNSLPPPISTNKSGLLDLPVSEYINSKLQVLQQFKNEYTKQDDFENAKKVKEIIGVIRKHGDRLAILQESKKVAVTSEEYKKAKQIKYEIDELKHDIQYVANNFFDPENRTIKPILRDTRLKKKIDQISDKNNDAMQNQSAVSRISQKLKKVQLQMLGQQGQVQSDEQKNEPAQTTKQADKNEDEPQFSKSQVSHDNRIIPTVLKQNKRSEQKLPPAEAPNEQAAYQDNEFIERQSRLIEDKEKLLEQLTPSAEANAAVLFQFYERDVVKKLHSKYWNFKIQALAIIIAQTKKWLATTSELDKNRVKSVLFTFNKTIKQVNFQVCNHALDLLGELTGSKKSVTKNLQTDLHIQLQKSINEIYLKIGDGQKIKQKCMQIINRATESELYGVGLVYSAISKSYFNQALTHNLKIKKEKLNTIENMVKKAGIGSKQGLPLSSVQLVARIAEDSNDEIRKQATSILKQMKEKGAGERVKEVVRSKDRLKGSIVRQLQN